MRCWRAISTGLSPASAPRTPRSRQALTTMPPEESPDGYGDHLDGISPLQLHRGWVFRLWQEATPSRAPAHGPRAVCVSLFPVQWLCHSGCRHSTDSGALAHTTLVLRHDECEVFCTHGLGPLSQRERAGGEGFCSLARTLEAPHPNPLPAGEGKEGMHQNHLDEVLGCSRPH